MNCDEVEIWISEASEDRLIALDENVKEHLQLCKQCEQKRLHVLQAYTYMRNQAGNSLSDEKTEVLLENLKSARIVAGSINRNEWLMRIAAVFVVALGVLLGVLVGNSTMFYDDENAYWTEEFAVITDSFDETIFE